MGTPFFLCEVGERTAVAAVVSGNDRNAALPCSVRTEFYEQSVPQAASESVSLLARWSASQVDMGEVGCLIDHLSS